MGTRAGVVVALLWAMLGVNVAFAADWSVIPSIKARTEFNSNLNYDFTNKVSDYIFTAQPAVDFNYTTEISQLQSRLGLTGMHYLSHGNIDHIDQNYQINGQYRITPRWNLSLRSAYIVDTTLQEELTASGLIMTRTPRQSIAVGPAVAYNITERLAATVNYNLYRVNYQDPRFRNYTSQLVGLRLDFPLKNQKTVLQGNIIGRQTRYSAGSDLFRSLGIFAGANHKFTENWEVNLLGGVNISFLDFNTQVQDFSQFPFFITVRTARYKRTEVGPFVTLATTRRWTNITVTGGYSRNQSASGLGTISDLNSLFLSMKYDFSERLSGVFLANYYLSKQVSQGNDFQNDYYSFSPQLTYRVTEKMSTSVGYSFSTRDDLTRERSASAHIAWLLLNYSYPIHY